MATTTDTFDWQEFLKSLQAPTTTTGTTTTGATTGATGGTTTGAAPPASGTPPAPPADGATDDWSKQFEALMKDLNASIGGVVNQDPTQAAQKAAAAQRAYQVATIPGYENLVGQAMQNIQSGLKGEVPESSQIAQAAREAGIGTGSRGPGAYLAALGLRSADVQQKALENLTAWQKGTTPDLSQFQATPSQQLEFQTNVGNISAKLLDIESALQSKQLDRNQELELERLREQFTMAQALFQEQAKRTPNVIIGTYLYDPINDTWTNTATGERGKGKPPVSKVPFPGYNLTHM